MAIFDQTNSADVSLETLVGEGKKYKTNDDLAKAYDHADRAIKEREQENQELRDELAKRRTAEELVEQFNANRREPPSSERDGTPNSPAPKVEVSDDDLVRRIREVQQQDNTQQTRERNLLEVAERLTTEFGDEDKANEVLKRKAVELGVSVKFLQDSAAQSPKAFYATLGLNVTATSPAQPAKGDVNTQAFERNSQSSAKPGTYQFYEALRKSDPVRWRSSAVQAQIHKDAQASPDTFFN